MKKILVSLIAIIFAAQLNGGTAFVPLFVESYRIDKESLEKKAIHAELLAIQKSEKTDEDKAKLSNYIYSNKFQNYYKKRINIIREIGKSRKASAVHHFRCDDNKEADIYYVDPELDITNEVIKQLNNEYLKTSK